MLIYGPFGFRTFLSGCRKNSGNIGLLKSNLKLFQIILHIGGRPEHEVFDPEAQRQAQKSIHGSKLFQKKKQKICYRTEKFVIKKFSLLKLRRPNLTPLKCPFWEIKNLPE